MNFSCRKSARLLSEAEDHALSRYDRFALGVHLMMCGMCRKYARQLQLLNKAFTSYRKSEISHQPLHSEPMPPEVRERLRDRLNKE